MKRIFDQYPMLILMGLLLAAAALGAYQYYPVHVQRKALRQILSKQNDKLDEIRTYSEKLPMLHRQVLELEPRAEEFSRLFPEEQGFSQLWQQIAEIMNGNHLSDQLVRPGQINCSEGFCSIPLEIQCSGTFENIFEFFRSLERFDRLIRLEEVHLSNASDLSGTLTLQAKAKIFYQAKDVQK